MWRCIVLVFQREQNPLSQIYKLLNSQLDEFTGSVFITRRGPLIKERLGPGLYGHIKDHGNLYVQPAVPIRK